jgi:hypothetical protein
MSGGEVVGAPPCKICRMPWDKHAEWCSEGTTMVPLPKKKRMVRVVTTQGMWFDLDMPDNFSMSAFATSIRITGFLLNDYIYQPAESIATIYVWEDKPPVAGEGVVIPFQKPPEKPA